MDLALVADMAMLACSKPDGKQPWIGRTDRAAGDVHLCVNGAWVMLLSRLADQAKDLKP